MLSKLGILRLPHTRHTVPRSIYYSASDQTRQHEKCLLSVPCSNWAKLWWRCLQWDLIRCWRCSRTWLSVLGLYLGKDGRHFCLCAFLGQGDYKLFSEPTITHNIKRLCATQFSYKYPSFAIVVLSYSLLTLRSANIIHPKGSSAFTNKTLPFCSLLLRKTADYSIALYHYITVYIKLIKLNQ